MDALTNFNLTQAIDNWKRSNFSRNELTPADEMELESHLEDIINELKEVGLSEEEAFAIARMRLGERKNWGDEMQIVNEDNFLLKNVIWGFYGILFYLFCFNFIITIARTLITILTHLNDDAQFNIDIIQAFYNCVYVVLIAGLVAVLCIHAPVKWLIQKISFNSKWIIIPLILVAVFIICELCTVPMINRTLIGFGYKSTYYHIEVYFRYFYPVIMLSGFLFIAIKFRKKYFS